LRLFCFILVLGGIMKETKIDPELVDDRDVQEEDHTLVQLPEYDPEQFELPDDFEYEEDEEDGSEA
jgi:hypothetical protein